MVNKIGIETVVNTKKAESLIEKFKRFIKKALGFLIKPLKFLFNTKEATKNASTLTKELNATEEAIREATESLKKLNKSTDKSAGGMKQNAKDTEGLNKRLRVLKTEARGTKRELDKIKGTGIPGYFNDVSKSLRKTLIRIGLFTTAFTIINRLKDLILGSAKASLEFETALAGVNKTMDLTAIELAGIDNELRALAKQTPLTYVELAKIAELGGQLAVPKEEIIEFTKVMGELRATTNITSEEGILKFAKFNNVMGITGDEIRRVASVIVDLGNNSATTESQILTFATRIASSGKIAGVSAQDIFAIATAFSSAGIEAEAGGTAVQKVLLDISKSVRKGGKQLEKYAKVSGLTASQFKEQWEESAGTAFAKFLGGLKDAGEQAGDVMEDLGQDNVRTVRAFLATAQSGKELEEHILRANVAYAENIALQEEFDKRAKTNASSLAKQKSRWQDLGKQLGDVIVPVFIAVQGALLDIVEALFSAFESLGIFTNAIIDSFKNLNFLNESLLALWDVLHTIPGPIGDSVKALDSLISKLTSTKDFAKKAKTTLKAFGIAAIALLGPITALTIGLLTLASAFAIYKESEELYEQGFINTNKQQAEVSKSISNSAEEIIKLRKDSLALAKEDTNESKKQLALNDKLVQIEEARIGALKTSRDLAGDNSTEKTTELNKQLLNQQTILKSLKGEYNDLAGIKIEAGVTTPAGTEGGFGEDGGDGDIGGGSAESFKENLDKKLKLLEQDRKKRLATIERFNKKIEISTETTTLKTSERVVKINQKALDEELKNLKNYSGEELDEKIKLIEKLDKIIKEHTKNVENQLKLQNKSQQDLYKKIVDGAKNAGKEVDDLNDKIKKLQNLSLSKDEKLADRNIEIGEESEELDDFFKNISKSDIKTAEGLSKEQLESIGDGTLASGLSGFDLLEIKENLEKKKELDQELLDNMKYINQTVLDQAEAYNDLSETGKILDDARKDELEALEELGGEYENLEEAIADLIKIRDEAQLDHDRLLALQLIAEQEYGMAVKIESDKIIVLRDLQIKKLDELIARQKRLNALGGGINGSAGNVKAPSSGGTTNTTNNTTINVNGASNPKTTAKQVAKVQNLASRGSLPSSNS